MSRIVLVTGGTRGIGAGIVKRFLAAGDRVWFTGRSEESIRAAEAAFGEGAVGRACDMADPNACETLATELLAAEGRIDVLINNAGITRDTLMMRMSGEQWDEVISTNLSGPFYLIRHFVKSMMKQRAGSIINLSSVVAYTGNPGQANYTAAKAGLLGFTRSLALELGGRGVRVNAVAPGYIDTDMTAAIPEAGQQALKSKIPLGRTGQAEDIAAACFFLAGEDAAYITGQCLRVDGGLTVS
jgi:3-oxoacyl-[acyl-carrier protein] reductase